VPTSNWQPLLIYRIDLPSKNNSILAFTLSTFFASTRTTQDDHPVRLECDRRSSRYSLCLAGCCPKDSREWGRTCSRTSLTCLRPFVEAPYVITTTRGATPSNRLAHHCQ
jgi:hypothetical protein